MPLTRPSLFGTAVMSSSARRIWLRRCAIALVLFVVAFVSLGYLSNAITAEASRSDAETWVNQQMAKSPNNWPHRSSSTKPAQSWIPWVQGVDYDFVVGNLGGEWGTRYYVTFFGRSFLARSQIRMQS